MVQGLFSALADFPLVQVPPENLRNSGGLNSCNPFTETLLFIHRVLTIHRALTCFLLTKENGSISTLSCERQTTKLDLC